jgi:hypothetical protein
VSADSGVQRLARDTPTFSATCDIDKPSLITA